MAQTCCPVTPYQASTLDKIGRCSNRAGAKRRAGCGTSDRGLQLITLDVSSDRDIETAFATLVQDGAGALLVGTGAYLASKRESLIALAARYAIPAMYQLREEVVAGGLMSYGPSQSNA
jgi:hypothetical protein